MVTANLVLASASPARLRTLVAAGVDPQVVVSGLDEDAVLASLGLNETSDPLRVVAVLARAKAQDVASRPEVRGSLVLGCDSMLELDGRVLGKPGTRPVAAQRWREMRGRTAVLHTGHHLVLAGSSQLQGEVPQARAVESVVSTRVHFADLSDAEIDAYTASGEPLGVAGAFTIDGLGAAFVSRIEGDHHNVVGVSVTVLRELTAALGVPWHTLWRASVPRP